VVEDDPAYVDVIQKTLPVAEPVSFHVESVARLSEALTRLQEKGIDLVLLDLGLPDSQGLATLHQLRRAAQDVPVIVLTGTVDHELAVAAVRDGAQDYLVKGQVSESLLVHAARCALERQKTVEALHANQRQLAEANQMLQLVMDTIPVRIFWKDRDLVYRGCNRLFAEDAGRKSPSDLLGDTDDSMGWREQAELYRRDDREVMRSGKPKQNYEEPQTTPDGKRIWLRTSKIPLRDVDNRIVGILGTYDDITERKRAEEALWLAHERLRQFVDSNIIGIVIANVPGDIVEANDYYLRLIGYTREELEQGKIDWRAVTPPEWLPADEQAIRELRERGTCTPYEKEYVRRDGTRISVFQTDAMLRGPGEQIVAFFLDITERKRAEKKVREQAALLDNANEAIYTTALDSTILYWNRGAERTYGWTSAEAVNRKATELIASDSAAPEALAAVLLKQESWSGERSQMTKNGQKVEVFSRMMLVRNEQGQPQAFFAINTDVTEKKQLEAQFFRAQRMESIGALASGIAHDLNNVLTPIIMGAPLLQNMVKDETAHRLLKTMVSSAQRGAAIVRQVLTFARGVEGERVLLQPRHLLREMERLAAETFPKGIRVKADAAADLWPILGDATQLHQALMNLCINARDAMPGGGVLTLGAANIVLSKETAEKIPGAQPGAYACLRVTDTGTGIPPEIEAKIFEPFFTTKGVGKGTGLGLSTVLGIVRSHGGFVRVASKMGQGSTFELYLPATTTEQVAAKSESATPWPRARGEGILVVDDEAAVREVARQALMEFGYQVITTGSGAEALRIFQERRREIRLVLTDMMMPEMDGPTLVAALRALDPKVKIVGITGMSDMAGMNGMKMLALSAMLAKPFTVEKLLAAIREALPVTAGPERAVPAGGESQPAPPG
jgi:PAS domain S-box-containing protein